MRKQARIVLLFILITFLFSTFLIPANINARVEFKQDVNFGEPGDDSGFSFNILPSTSSNGGTSETTSGSQNVKTDNINTLYLYSKILCGQFIAFIF